MVGAKRLVAESLAAALVRKNMLFVAGEVALTADEAARLTASSRPDVVVVDASSPRQIDAREVVEKCSAAGVGTRPLLLTASQDRLDVQRISQRVAVVAKSSSIVELASAIHRHSRGERFEQAEASCVDRQVSGRLATLSYRELDVVRAVASGSTVKEAARELFLSTGTVRNHLHRVFRKTGVSSRSELLDLIRSDCADPSWVADRAARSSPVPRPGALISVLVASRERLDAEALAHAVNRARGVRVVSAVSGPGAVALHSAIRNRPRVLLYDASIQGLPGSALVRYLRRWVPGTTVVVLSSSTSLRDASPQRVGRIGVVSNAASVRDLANAVRIFGKRVHEVRHDSDRRYGSVRGSDWTRMESLTPRELEVLQAVAVGTSSSDIARQLHVAPATVRNHLTAILRKTQTGSRAEALGLARQVGAVVGRRESWLSSASSEGPTWR